MKKKGRPPKKENKPKLELEENKEAETIQPYNIIEKILDRIAEKYYIRIEINPKNHVDRNGWNVYLEKRRN